MRFYNSWKENSNGFDKHDYVSDNYPGFFGQVSFSSESPQTSPDEIALPPLHYVKHNSAGRRHSSDHIFFANAFPDDKAFRPRLLTNPTPATVRPPKRHKSPRRQPDMMANVNEYGSLPFSSVLAIPTTTASPTNSVTTLPSPPVASHSRPNNLRLSIHNDKSESNVKQASNRNNMNLANVMKSSKSLNFSTKSSSSSKDSPTTPSSSSSSGFGWRPWSTKQVIRIIYKFTTIYHN